jgi:(p)ppGpp synthase/HD superfamily hydrolase
MIRFEDLLEKVRAYSPDADVEMLRRAYVFSAFEHRGQVRRSGEPYLIHPLAVAEFLVELKLDAVAIAAGRRHDVVEDTLTTIERIRELFVRRSPTSPRDQNQRDSVFIDRRTPGGNRKMLRRWSTTFA